MDRNYSRRPGTSFKSDVPDKDYSKYFENGLTKAKWIPPRSPYALIQEDLYSDPWQLLVATVFLTKTSASKAIPRIHKFLGRFPSVNVLLQADRSEVKSYLDSLGLENVRTEILFRFSREYVDKKWEYPIELFGIGKYGNDSFKIFCAGEWLETSPDDIPLSMYRNWLIENRERLGL